MMFDEVDYGRTSSYSGKYVALWLRRPGFDSRTGQSMYFSFNQHFVLHHNTTMQILLFVLLGLGKHTHAELYVYLHDAIFTFESLLQSSQ